MSRSDKIPASPIGAPGTLAAGDGNGDVTGASTPGKSTGGAPIGGGAIIAGPAAPPIAEPTADIAGAIALGP
jgi:hypothetical protein